MKAREYDLSYLSNMDGEGPHRVQSHQEALSQAAGKKIRWLMARVNKPADADAIAACREVDHLWVWGWPDPDLARLRHLAPVALRLVRGRQSSLRGLNDSRLRTLWLDGPSKVLALQPLAAPHVELGGCNGLDLNTLENVRGLACLSMQSMKSIPTLAFVSHCPALEGLTFAGYAFKATDLSPLTQSRSLRLIYSNKLKDDQVAAIGSQNRRVFVCNERTAFEAGKSVASFEYGDFEDRWNALLAAHGVEAPE